jgi:hypothetical protein
MLDAGEWSKNFTYVTCEEYNEDNLPNRKNFDLRRYLKQVSPKEHKVWDLGNMRKRSNIKMR